MLEARWKRGGGVGRSEGLDAGDGGWQGETTAGLKAMQCPWQCYLSLEPLTHQVQRGRVSRAGHRAGLLPGVGRRGSERVGEGKSAEK